MQKVHQQLISTGGNFIAVLLKSASEFFLHRKRDFASHDRGDGLA